MTEEYDRGYADGWAARQAEIESLELMVDAWYFRANNPKSKWPEHRLVKTIIEGMEVREERARTRAALDAAEAVLFDEARALLAQGKSDIEVATEVGIFLPIVANLRAGVL